MKTKIISLLFIALLGITISESVAQQNQNAPKTDTEVEKLRIQLKTVENEKIEVETKLAEANAKLVNTDIDKLKGELRESNNDWLKSWSGWFLTIIGIFAAILLGVSYVFWYWLRTRTDQLIATEVEKRLDRFQDSIEQVDTLTNELKESVEKVNILESQVTILNKEHAANIIEEAIQHYYNEPYYKELINRITEEALLDLFNDDTRHIRVRSKAIKALADRKSTKSTSPVLEFLNSTLDSDTYKEAGFDTKLELKRLVDYLGMTHTQESYDGLTIFLDRLLQDDTEMTDFYITWTVFSLAYIGSAINTGSSVSIMKEAIPSMRAHFDAEQAFQNLAGYFDKFNEPDGIKEILSHFGLMTSDLKETCLTLLQKHDPVFVEEQRAAETTINTENEDTE